MPIMDTTKVPLGEKSGPFDNFCDPDEIAAFGLAINDDNPRYQDGSAVPPTYAVAPVFEAFRSIPQLSAEAMVGGRGGGHGEHVLIYHKLITPGMTLHTTADRYAVVTSKAGMNVFVRLLSVDDAGETVLEQYWSTINVGEVTGGDQGGPVPDHTFPEDARSRLVGSRTITSTRDQTFRYAGGSGDRAIIHVSDQAATRMGQSGKFLQGMLSLGMSSRVLVELAAGGDPSRIRHVAVRFAGYVFPQKDIEVSVYEIGALPNGRTAYAFEGVSEGRTVLRHGRIEVDPA
jgi:acyl dehydratase